MFITLSSISSTSYAVASNQFPLLYSVANASQCVSGAEGCPCLRFAARTNQFPLLYSVAGASPCVSGAEGCAYLHFAARTN
jgi:hypothetical protein